MAYHALHEMRERNKARYGIENSVAIPPLPQSLRKYGTAALAFLREDCEDLKFDRSPERAALADHDGRSAAVGQIPYNMERDLDRLSFEAAIGRFLSSGSREDAFDIYYCYCEIFKPFGAGYDAAGLLLELLSEHETNASSLLMKHRDHYSHSVYVFLIGLAIYRELPSFRSAYHAAYGLSEGKEAACHFLEYWGLSSLFHDIGYPFEIAHQQMKAYVCQLDKNCNDKNGFAPYVSYRSMNSFARSALGDLNELYAQAVTQRLGESYLSRVGADPCKFMFRLLGLLKDRAIHEDPADPDYRYMDHAYFSGLTLAKLYLDRHPEIRVYEALPKATLDAFCAILLHNSLFKFAVRSILHTKEPLRLSDGQPLAYLLMLCDELQCWDRASYGQNSRSGIFAYDFDMEFTGGKMQWHYYYDKLYEEKVLTAAAYRNMCIDGQGRSKFADTIAGIIALQEVLPDFESKGNVPDPSGCITVHITEKTRKSGLYLSDSNYLNLYRFALALHGRYAGVSDAEAMQRAFEEELSLEYKLSNIAQAKGFAKQLESIGCFYTDRPVDYPPVTSFRSLISEPGHEADLRKISQAEHERWVSERYAMGWRPGTYHLEKKDKIMRECTRLHHDFIPFEDLTAEEQDKDTLALEKMLELIRQYDGLTVYRMQ